MARRAARCTPGTSHCMFDALEPGTERVELRTGSPGSGPSSGACHRSDATIPRLIRIASVPLSHAEPANEPTERDPQSGCLGLLAPGAARAFRLHQKYLLRLMESLGLD